MIKIFKWISVGLLFQSCQITDPKTDEKKYVLHPTIKENTKYYYNINNNLITKITFNDKKISTNNSANIGLYYESSKDSAGDNSIKMTYDQLRIKLTDGDNTQELDVANADHTFNNVEKILGVIKGSQIFITTDDNGNVKSVKGEAEISEKILKALPSQDENTRKTLQAQISKLAGEGFVKNNLSQLFTLLPDTGIRVGESWKIEQLLSDGMDFTLTTNYTLESVKDSIASIVSRSVIGNAANVKSTVMGYETSSDISGDQKGEYKLNLKTGMLMEAETKSLIAAKVTVLGKEMPVNIEMNKKIVAKKL